MLKLMPLPYAMDALEPHVSAETLGFHHGKHHAAYVKKTNAITAGTELADLSLETLIEAAATRGQPDLVDQAAQVWNHGFYWHSLNPDNVEPAAALNQAIARDHGSLAQLKAALAEAAIAHFGSGWVWLAERQGEVVVTASHDAETLAVGAAKPLLVIDVWEHAYYLDRQNDRAGYVGSVVEHLLNWDFASRNFERTTAWTYPV